MKTCVVEVAAHGGPDVLRVAEREVPEPGPGEALVVQRAIGLNYIDVYHRTGLYPAPDLPFVPGVEGAGFVSAVGPGVTEVAPGDRVAYAARPLGAYAAARCMPADRLARLPSAIGFVQAAGLMLKGLTAHMLLRRVRRVQPGDTILVHAAAGGVGSLLCQWGNRLGATVIGTVGSAEKAERARAHGCHHPILYREENFRTRTSELTEGSGVCVVYDSVGRDTFDDSLDCLSPLGTMVSFGQSSGTPDDVPLAALASRGSLSLTRPSLMDYTAGRADLLAAAGELFAAVEAGDVHSDVGREFSLEEAEQAHRALEARETMGATVLIPSE